LKNFKYSIFFDIKYYTRHPAATCKQKITAHALGLQICLRKAADIQFHYAVGAATGGAEHMMLSTLLALLCVFECLDGFQMHYILARLLNYSAIQPFQPRGPALNRHYMGAGM
jgi:hypothetical protein